MDKKITVQLDKDGFPVDDVSHYAATPEHLQSFEQAADQLSRFKAPALLDKADPHSYLLVGLLDGTGNDVEQDKVHATNVAKFRQQIWDIQDAGVDRVYVEYSSGPGTQSNPIENKIDGATGRTSLGRAEEMYEKLVKQAQEIFKADPDAKISFHLEGFSRGASQVPLLARMIDERGITDPKGVRMAADADGNPVQTNTRYYQTPGSTPMSVGLYDPVPTGYMETMDRRLPPSVVSGFQISAANERRGLFRSDVIIPLGLSEDGRFLNVAAAGAHSDIGGSYALNGLGIRNFNLMTDYHNRVLGEPLLQRLHEPTDPRMNVIHRSEEGMALYRVAPKIDRATPEGQIRELSHDYSRTAAPGEVVHVQHMPQPLSEEMREVANRGQFVQRTALTADAALTEGDTLVARLSQVGGVEFRTHEVLMMQKLMVRGSAVGVAASAYEALTTGQRAADLYSRDNPLAATHALRDYLANNSTAWVAGVAMAKVGAEIGGTRYGLVGAAIGGIEGGLVGYLASDEVMKRLDSREIYNQTDRDGVDWRFNGVQWLRQDKGDLIDDGRDAPQQQAFSALPEKADELNYRATNTAVVLAMGRTDPPRNPYAFAAGEGDRASLRESRWEREPQSGQWHRNVVVGVDRNDKPIHELDVATAQRAAELDRQSEQVVRANIANSPAAIATHYDLAYRSNGWKDHGDMPPAVQTALSSPDTLVASNGKAYQRSADGAWTHDGALAEGNLKQELDATYMVFEPALAEHKQAMVQVQPRPPLTPEERDRANLAMIYAAAGNAPYPETMEAAYRAVQQTRAVEGIGSATTSLALGPSPNGGYDVDSPILHLGRDGNNVVRIAATTSTEDIHQTLADVKAKGMAPVAPVPEAPELRIAPQSPQEREAYEQALREANRQGVSTQEAQQVATFAAATMGIPRLDETRAPQAAIDAQQERESTFVAEVPPPAQPTVPVPPVASTSVEPDVTEKTQEVTNPAERLPERATPPPPPGAEIPRENTTEIEAPTIAQPAVSVPPLVSASVESGVPEQTPVAAKPAEQPSERTTPESLPVAKTPAVTPVVSTAPQQEAATSAPVAAKPSEPGAVQAPPAPAVPADEPIKTTAPTPATPSEPDGLRLGDQGQDVELLQYRLQRVGANGPEGQPVPQDGRYGPETAYAVRQFQQTHGLPATGVADQAVHVALAREQQTRLEQTKSSEQAAPARAGLEQGIERRSPNEVQVPAISEAQRQAASPVEAEQAVASLHQTPSRPDAEARIQVSDVARSAYASPSLGGLGGTAKSQEHDDEQLDQPAPRQNQAQTFPSDHPDYALFAAIQAQLPKGTPDEKTAEVMHWAKVGGVERADQFEEVVIENDRAFVYGKTPGFYRDVSLATPPPAMEETLRNTQTLDQKRAQEMEQFVAKQEEINLNPNGPVMTLGARTRQPVMSDGGNGDGGGGGDGGGDG